MKGAFSQTCLIGGKSDSFPQIVLKKVLDADESFRHLGREEVAQKERISTLFANIKNLMEKMGWSAEQSMDVLSVSDSDRKALWQLLK